MVVIFLPTFLIEMVLSKDRRRISYSTFMMTLVHFSVLTHGQRTPDIFTRLFILPFSTLSLSSCHHLIQMHGCIFGLCRDGNAPGGFSWNEFTLCLPSHWSTIYRPSTFGAAGRPFNRYISCLMWQSSYRSYANPCFKHERFNISGLPLIIDNA